MEPSNKKQDVSINRLCSIFRPENTKDSLNVKTKNYRMLFHLFHLKKIFSRPSQDITNTKAYNLF